jgi:8-amino-7-oxononanoate synthase
VALAERENAGLYRRRRIVGKRSGAMIELDGRELVDFSSNDYLGFATDPRVAAVMADAARSEGAGAAAAHVVTGHHRLHDELEVALAVFTARDRALLFSTGYMANLGIAAAFAPRGALVVEDRLNHASLIDAGRSRGTRLARYDHCDAVAAAERLAVSDAPVKIVLTDGVFSMDGNIAPLSALAAACREHDAWLAVDDAHGLGVIGATGRGSVEHHGLGQAEVPVLMGTLGKAFGVFGAFVAGPEPVIETLIQHARTYTYTTALPPAVAAAALAALRLSESEPWRRDRLVALVERFRRGATECGIEVSGSCTPIQPLICGETRNALSLQATLEGRGFLVTAIRPPTVPNGSARLRITLSAAHDEAQVDGLVAALADALV